MNELEELETIDSQEKSGRERRRFLRVPLHCKAHITLDDSEIEASCVNISLSALFLESPIMPIGSNVTVRLETPDKLAVRGVVFAQAKRQGRGGMVVRFAELTPTLMNQITGYMSRMPA